MLVVDLPEDLFEPLLKTKCSCARWHRSWRCCEATTERKLRSARISGGPLWIRAGISKRAIEIVNEWARPGAVNSRARSGSTRSPLLMQRRKDDGSGTRHHDRGGARFDRGVRRCPGYRRWRTEGVGQARPNHLLTNNSDSASASAAVSASSLFQSCHR